MLPALLFYFSLVNDVRTLIARHDLDAADRAVQAYRSQAGTSPELAAALSWMARGSFDAGRLDQAENYSAEARKLVSELMRTRRLDADGWLPMALGGSLEVHAQVLVARGERVEAITFLRQQLAAYRSTTIAERLRKNLNLLSLEGKAAPTLDTAEWLGPPPPPRAQWRGHPVLLFFWAHWCPDCKAEAPILASLMKTYGPRGVLLIAPTKYYGYAAGGEDAPPNAEKRYIERIWREFYSALPATPVPLSAANFLVYGASTTPTLVLLDPEGIVRFYHPGAASEAELSSRIQSVLRK